MGLFVVNRKKRGFFEEVPPGPESQDEGACLSFGVAFRDNSPSAWMT